MGTYPHCHLGQSRGGGTGQVGGFAWPAWCVLSFLLFCKLIPNVCFFLRFYLFIFREIEEGREKEGEKHQCVVVSHAPPTGDLAHNPGTCPDWESNGRPFGS